MIRGHTATGCSSYHSHAIGSLKIGLHCFIVTTIATNKETYEFYRKEKNYKKFTWGPCNVISSISRVINRWLFDFYQRIEGFLDPIYALIRIILLQLNRLTWRIIELPQFKTLQIRAVWGNSVHQLIYVNINAQLLIGSHNNDP